MKCKDCGATNYEPSSQRSDVCLPCFDLRKKLLVAMDDGEIGMDEFRQIQRVLAAGRGRGANCIRRALSLTSRTAKATGAVVKD